MSALNPAKPSLKVLLCSPRGFCAGVVRAIDSVEQALLRYGAPVYVRHEIVHNRYVVESLKRKGAVFVRELDEIPDTGAPVIFSAHGVPKAVPEAADARRPFQEEDGLAFVTQTTLSVDDTREIVEALQTRYPGIAGPHKEDICYATTNRQGAVKRVAPLVDAMIVVGSSNSSNSQRLREVAEREGCPLVRLVLRAEDIDWSSFGAI